MEGIVIPNISGILSEARNVIDRPATLAEYMSIKCNEDQLVQTILTVKNILTKLAKHQGSHDETTTDDPSSLVKVIAMVINDVFDNKHNSRFTYRMKSKILGLFKNKCIKTKETIDDHLRKDLEEKKRSLFKMAKDHTKLVDKIHQTQKDCLISKSKKNVAELALLTARQARANLDAELSANEARSRDLAIQELQMSLAIKQKRQHISDLEFQKLICKEESLRIEMKKISKELQDEITTLYTERWEQAVFMLKQMSEKTLPTESQIIDLEKIKQLNIQAVSMKILSKDRFLYTFPILEEFKRVDILKEIQGRD